MNSYKIGGKSETIRGSAMVWTALVATQLLVANAEAVDQKVVTDHSVMEMYRLGHDISSTGRLSQVTISAVQDIALTPDLEVAVTQFFEKLSANQEPLGSEFSAILHKHRWDLYES